MLNYQRKVAETRMYTGQGIIAHHKLTFRCSLVSVKFY